MPGAPADSRRKLQDYLRKGLDVVFVGINPGTRSAAAGHHYAGPGNHFWPLLYQSGIVPLALTYEQDARVLEWGVGLTNMVARSSPSISDLSLYELRAGAAVLRRKLERYHPRFACFNGKRIYEVFAGHPCDFGLQSERLGETRIFVMPSTSARTASYQRADKLRYFQELARLLGRARRRST
jgi:TDG/mug DNA glycosylase family protein